VTLQKQIEAQAKTIDMLLSRLDLDGTSSRGM
jgi:hypothetical protein